MKPFQLTLTLAIGVCMLQLFSCTKTIDTTSGDSLNMQIADNLTFPTTNEFAGCKLRRIYQRKDDLSATLNGVFTYNAAGNPVSLVFQGDIAPYFLFTYDSKGRLGKYTTYDAAPNITTQHFYGYDANNRIIKDTVIADPQPYNNRRFVSTFTYDNQGRIIKENIKNYYNDANVDGNVPPLLPDRNPTFTYDVRGNLAVAGWKSSSYDNKVSIFRMHPVFQFIHRNYSKNNSSVQAKYNSKGLPLSVVPGNDVFFTLPNVKLAVYDCQ